MPITLQDLAESRSEAIFTYNGHEIHVHFRVEVITKEFRAESLRLQREGARIQRRSEELTERIKSVVAADGTPEAQAEDAQAEKDIEQLQEDDKSLKRQIDRIVMRVVDEWDVMSGKEMLPLTLETLYPIPAEFEYKLLQAVMESIGGGEATTAPSAKP